MSVTTPTVDDTSAASIASSSTITEIPNDSQSEQADETSSTDADQTTLSSITTIDEPVDDRTKYGAKRRYRKTFVYIIAKDQFTIFPRHNIIELIETEKEYVKDLALVVEVKQMNIFILII